MSSIHNVGGNSPVQKIYTKPVQKPVESQPSQPTRGADKLELSGASHLLATLKAGGNVRADKVASIKSQIEAGTYEDDQKLNAATDRLLDELMK